MPVMSPIGMWLAAFAAQAAASRTRAITSSRGVVSLTLALAIIAVRSRITNETSASGSASAWVALPPGADSASRRCGLNGGILAMRLETPSDRLPPTRTKGRTRTTS